VRPVLSYEQQSAKVLPQVPGKVLSKEGAGMGPGKPGKWSLIRELGAVS
jgi:hypothetical protein